MKRRSSLGFFVVIAVLAVVGCLSLASQWQESLLLRADLELARREAGKMERLRAENERLRAEQIPATELEGLRADHAALPRLRAEMDALNKRSAANVNGSDHSAPFPPR